MFLDQLVDSRAGDRNQLRAAGRGRILDVRCRTGNDEGKAVNLVVAQGRAMLVRLQLGGQRKIAGFHVRCSQQHAMRDDSAQFSRF